MASTEPHDRVRESLARLEDGVHAVQTGQAWAEYLRAVSRFHRYSAGNVWLILAQRPDASRVAGVHTWRALGGHVRRGEHGIRILAPVTMRSRDDEATDDPEAAEVDRVVTRFRVVTVFDIASTDGEPLPTHPCQALATSSERGRWLLARLLDVARGEGIAVRQDVPGLGAAHGAYIPADHAIVLAAGLSDDQCAKTSVSDVRDTEAAEALIAELDGFSE